MTRGDGWIASLDRHTRGMVGTVAGDIFSEALRNPGGQAGFGVRLPRRGLCAELPPCPSSEEGTMRRFLSVPAALLAVVPAVVGGQKAAPKCDADNAGLKLPAGFCAIVFADSMRGARH